MTGTHGFPVARLAEPGPRCTGSASRDTAGLTLLELLIVLVIIAMVAAIAWPNVAAAWRENSFTASMGLTESALSNARLDAMRRGEALNAEVEERANGAIVLVLSRAAGGVASDTDGGLLPDDLASRPGATEDDDPEWKQMVPLSLPSGYRIIDPTLEPDPADPMAASAFEPVAPIGGLGAEPDPLPLATFFPDGSALSVGRLALVDARGRRAWIEVGAVSGRVRLIRDDPPVDAPDEAEPSAEPTTRDDGLPEDGGVR